MTSAERSDSTSPPSRWQFYNPDRWPSSTVDATRRSKADRGSRRAAGSPPQSSGVREPRRPVGPRPLAAADASTRRRASPRRLASPQELVDHDVGHGLDPNASAASTPPAVTPLRSDWERAAGALEFMRENGETHDWWKAAALRKR